MTTQPVNPSGRDSVHAHKAEVEAAARAIRVAQASDPDDQRRLGEGWDAYLVDHDEAEALMRQARAARAAAMPLIRERLAQEVLDGCDDVAVQPCRTCRHAARIVRGDAL